jgi:hypothetical protein
MFEVPQTYRIGSNPPRKRPEPPRRKKKTDAEPDVNAEETQESQTPPEKDPPHRIDIEI